MLAILSAQLDFLSKMKSVKINGIATMIFGITMRITSLKKHTLIIPPYVFAYEAFGVL